MKDFSNYKFRCSQLSLIMGGTIGITEEQEKEIVLLKNERDTGINANGNKCKWTDAKKAKLEKLEAEKANPSLPKTMESELKKIYRAEKYNRNFVFTNKFVQKGIAQEDEAITLYMNYRNAIGKRTMFTKNEVRLNNEWISGEPDLNPIEVNGKKIGFDTKCSYELKTFPFPDDPLDSGYDWQNQGYIFLTGADRWKTVYCLVNCTEDGLHKEKLKWFYALKTKSGTPDEPDHKHFYEYQKKCKEVERMMIFDYDRFVEQNAHFMEYSKEEWHGNDLDIPMENRVQEFLTERDEQKIEMIKERVEIGRKYLMQLQKMDEEKLIAV